jgi:hypothetical protein
LGYFPCASFCPSLLVIELRQSSMTVGVSERCAAFNSRNGGFQVQRGTPPSQAAQILGHKNAELTLKVYTHWFKGVSSASVMADLAGAICPARPTGSKTVAAASADELAAAK